MIDDVSWDYTPLLENIDYVHTSHSYGVGAPGGLHLVEYRASRAGSFGVHVERDLHQLTWLDGGVLDVFTAGEFHTISPGRAIWIPAGTAHDVACAGPGRLVCLYFRDDDESLDVESPTLVVVDELLRGLVQHLLSGLTQEAGLRARQVLLDALGGRTIDSGRLALPSDPRARAIAEEIAREPAQAISLEVRAHAVGSSARTIRRKFVSETGLTFRQWVHRARVTSSLSLLETERSVTQISALAGYETVTGFITAFRAHFGHTPGQYRARLRAMQSRPPEQRTDDSTTAAERRLDKPRTPSQPDNPRAF